MNTTVAAKTVNIDGLDVPINGERNLLELIRKADIDLPTFCYHSRSERLRRLPAVPGGHRRAAASRAPAPRRRSRA